MELSFIASALRRRFWVVLLVAILGAIPGLTKDATPSTNYRSTAELMVSPSTRATANYNTIDPERYVAGQLEVLQSESLADQVASQVSAQFGERISVAALGSVVEIEQVPETDVVTIVTTINSAEKAQAISQAYAELYLAGLANVELDNNQIQALQSQISALEFNLREANDQLQESMAKWLPRGNDPTPPPIPSPETVDPVAVSQRQLLLADLTQKRAALSDLDIQSRLHVNSRVISSASLPLEPIPLGGDFLLAGGLFGGAVLGIVVAVGWARFSTKVLDEAGVAELLGTPVVAELGRYRSLSRNLLAAFQSLPRSAWPVVDQLCVRAEAMAKIGEPLTVAVTGTMRAAGTTTLALAMAERFAAGGATVVLVDADVREPHVTGLFNATADGGVPAITSGPSVLGDEDTRSAYTRTMDPAVSVLGLGPNRGAAALRRDTVPDVLAAARAKADIVVVDGGPVLDLASTLQFVALADAVILAVPMVRQKTDELGGMGRQLEPVRAKLMPVITSPTRRQAKGQTEPQRAPAGSNQSRPSFPTKPADTGAVPAVPPSVPLADPTTKFPSARPPSTASSLANVARRESVRPNGLVGDKVDSTPDIVLSDTQNGLPNPQRADLEDNEESEVTGHGAERTSQSEEADNKDVDDGDRLRG